MLQVQNILVATDFGDCSAAALRYGRDLARAYGATLHVLHVADDLIGRVALTAMSVTPDIGELQMDVEKDARRSLDGLVTDDDRTSLRAKSILLTSVHPAEQILSYAREAAIDLVVMGTHGRTGLSHLVTGSVAERVVRQAPCPVLTVRQPEREFIQPDALQVAHAER